MELKWSILLVIYLVVAFAFIFIGVWRDRADIFLGLAWPLLLAVLLLVLVLSIPLHLYDWIRARFAAGEQGGNDA